VPFYLYRNQASLLYILKLFIKDTNLLLRSTIWLRSSYIIVLSPDIVITTMFTHVPRSILVTTHSIQSSFSYRRSSRHLKCRIASQTSLIRKLSSCHIRTGRNSILSSLTTVKWTVFRTSLTPTDLTLLLNPFDHRYYAYIRTYNKLETMNCLRSGLNNIKPKTRRVKASLTLKFSQYIKKKNR
jgi:hypothetical protein